MMSLPNRAFAEAIGRFFLCFVGVSAICTDKLTGGGSGLLGIALAHGLALSIAITALGKISGGHFNPAVSIAMAATRQMSPLACIVYIVGQLLGATAAGFAARGCFPATIYTVVGGGFPVPNFDSGLIYPGAVAQEAIATFFLLIAIFGTAVDIKAPSVGGFGIWLTVAFDILAIGPLTGASMNPARTFGPGLAARSWTNHAVYWIGPVIGAVVGAWVYVLFFLSPVPPREARRQRDRLSRLRGRVRPLINVTQ